MTGALEKILDRPRTVLTLMVAMVMAGIFTYITIPKEANPDIDVPVFVVSLVQEGVSPNDAERLLVRPMETELRGIEGLKELTAVARQGGASITLEFRIGLDQDALLADIRDKVDLAQAELPEDAEEPAIFETNFALQPTIIVALSGNVPERTLFQNIKRLQDEVESISTVREATLTGTREEQIEVLLDLVKLESYNITQQELLNSVTQYNQLVPAGFLDDGNARFNLEVPGRVETLEDVYAIPIKQSGEGVVTLGEVAQIRRTFKDASSYTRVNGKPAMSLEVVKRIGTNIIENNREVRRVVENFTKDWPETINVTYMIDQSSFIYEVLGSLQSAILTAIVLVLIIVVASLGVGSGLLVGLAIPTSFMVSFLILSGSGLTVNMMVMFGMVLTVGMLVDGAIVVVEYANRKMAEGVPAREAYPKAAKLMFWPVVSSTATTLAAFLPLLLWPGVPGEFMSYLPIMVIFVLSASLVTALIFLPTTGIVLSETTEWLRGTRKWVRALMVAGLAGLVVHMLPGDQFTGLVGLPVAQTVANWIAIFGTATLAFLLSLAFLPKAETKEQKAPILQEDAKMFSAEGKLDVTRVAGFMGGYLRTLKLLSGNLIGNVVVIVAVVAFSYATFVYYGENGAGVEFFVDEEPDIALVFVSARGNLSGSDIRDIAVKVEEEVMQVKGVENVVLTATAPGAGGGGAANPAAPQDVPSDMIATITIELEEYSERRRAVEIFDEIRMRTADLAGIKVELRKLEGGPPTGKDVRLEVKSTDYDSLVEAVTFIRNGYFNRQVDLQDVEDERPLPGIDWELSVDREEAGRYNASIPAIGAVIQLITNGALIGTSTPDDSDEQIDIRVRLPENQRSLERLGELRLNTENGQVPLSNFVDVTAEPKVSSIQRRDGLYAMDIKANLLQSEKDAGLTPDDKVGQVQAWLDQQEFGDNIFLRFRGADEEQKESGAFLAKAGIGAMLLMFVILVTQFNSFYQTFVTLLTVILAAVGVLIGMLVTGYKFSFIMTGTGVVALAGIVVNNAIVLIDTYNRLRSEGVEVCEAVLKTSAQRIRPIMLTTVTTIMGLIPMAMQINFDFIAQTITVGSITAIWWVQLSIAIISGLAFSTILTLLLIPVMLALPTNVASLFKRRSIETIQEPDAAPADIASQVLIGNVQPDENTNEPVPLKPRKKRRKPEPEARPLPDAAE